MTSSDLGSNTFASSSTGSSGSGYGAADLSGRLHEDNLTVRRREANRLAAQRFRSRKKGYQDSLEERIRILEEEREALLFRDAGPGDDAFYRKWPTRPSTAIAAQSARPPEPEAFDIDVRIAALESANRRLQEELRVVSEDNDRLRDEVDRLQAEADRWRNWESTDSRWGNNRTVPRVRMARPSF